MNFIHIFPSNCNIKYKLKATQFLENSREFPPPERCDCGCPALVPSEC